MGPRLTVGTGAGVVFFGSSTPKTAWLALWTYRRAPGVGRFPTLFDSRITGLVKGFGAVASASLPIDERAKTDDVAR